METGNMRSGSLFAAALAACLTFAPSAALAQGRWEFGIGAFGNSSDTLSTSGLTGEFARWRGPERLIRRGMRIAYYRRRTDNVTRPPVPGSVYQVTEEWSAWGVGVGAPFQIAATGASVRPFFEAEPGLMLYHSGHEIRYTHLFTGKVGIEDHSGWHLGPTLTLGVGLQVPGRNNGLRLRVRGGYRIGWLAGGEGTGLSGSKVSAWELRAGGSIPY
jgi:hypothetical protein